MATLHVANFRLSVTLAFGTFFDAILIRVQSEIDEVELESIDSSGFDCRTFDRAFVTCDRDVQAATSGDNDAEDTAVLVIFPACPLVLVEAPLSTDSRDASWDNTGRKAEGVRGSAFSRVARTITHYRHSARRTTAVM